AGVPVAVERWRADGIQIGIFSSGSVLAQKLLFRHSSAGDLTDHLQWYFDTTTGPKGDPESYRRIATAIAMAASAVLFVSDVVREWDAARLAGMRTALPLRPCNEPPPAHHSHTVIRSFHEVNTKLVRQA